MLESAILYAYTVNISLASLKGPLGRRRRGIKRVASYIEARLKCAAAWLGLQFQRFCARKSADYRCTASPDGALREMPRATLVECTKVDVRHR